ncbi:MAG: hypothetical protein ACUZ77_12035 [Candidatus Brocadiales bacterium]
MNTNQAPLIGIITHLRSSIYLFKNNVRLLIGIPGILLLVNIAMGFALVSLGILGGVATHSNIETDSLSLLKASTTFLGLFLIFMWLVAYAWVSGSLIIAVRETASGKVTTIKDALQDGWLIKWSFLLVTILFGLVIVGGMILLIIPGIIFFTWYFLCYYVLVCENITGRAALSRSRELVRGYWWSVTTRVVFLFVMVGGISFIISFIPFFGGILHILFYYLIELPFSTIYFFILYKNLEAVKRPLSPS